MRSDVCIKINVILCLFAEYFAVLLLYLHWKQLVYSGVSYNRYKKSDLLLRHSVNRCRWSMMAYRC